MAGTRLEATFDLDQADHALRFIEALGHDATPLTKQIGAGIAALTRRRLGGATDPWGNPWAPLNPAYAATKKKPGMLREMGDAGGLSGSITFEAAPHSVVVGSNKVYAGVHQSGATITPVSASALVFRLGGEVVHAKRVKIPARPYLGIGPKEELLIKKAFADVIQLAFR